MRPPRTKYTERLPVNNEAEIGHAPDVHRVLLHAWLNMGGVVGADLPDFRIEDLPGRILPHLVCMECPAGEDDFMVRVAGAIPNAVLSVPLTGKFLRELPISPDSRQTIAEENLWALAHKQPLYVRRPGLDGAVWEDMTKLIAPIRGTGEAKRLIMSVFVLRYSREATAQHRNSRTSHYLTPE